MSNKLCKQGISGNKTQEAVMKEVLGGLEEIATMLSYDPWPGDFEIIAVYPPHEERDHSAHEQVVVKSRAERAQRQQAQIISYEEQKARLLKSA